MIKLLINPPTRDKRRIGAVKDRSQTYNPKTDQWVKRDTTTGKSAQGFSVFVQIIFCLFCNNFGLNLD